MSLKLVAVAVLIVSASVAVPERVAAQDTGARELELSFDPAGLVTLVADKVSLRDILAEWTRLGGSRFINAERLPATPLSLPVRFENEPETAVLAALLRSASGYIVSPRLEGQPGTSRIGAVYIVATSTATAAPVNTFAPSFSSQPVPLAVGSPDDELPPIVPPGLSSGQPAAQQQPSATQPSSPFVGGPNGVFGTRTPTTAPGSVTPAPEPRQTTPPPPVPSGTPQPVPIVPVVPIIPVGN